MVFAMHWAGFAVFLSLCRLKVTLQRLGKNRGG